MAKQIQNPRGTKDILPDEQNAWQYIYDIFQEKMNVFGAGRIETPIIEFAETFIRSIGKGTDIVDKEMFEVRRMATAADTLDEEDSKTMVLRPEYTAGIMRSYIQNGMATWPQPVKLWYFGPAFRYERPQAGRYRIHWQCGLEVIGDSSSLTDTSLILLAWQFLKKLGLEKNLKLDINSIGCNTCRPKMKKKQVEYFQNFLADLCPDCNRRFIENPLRIFDCKQTKCQKIINSAPQIIDLLCSDCKTHFKQVLENLDYLQIPYNLNSRLVRGLDYYCRTVFEIYLADDKERNTTLLAGGRYDLGPLGLSSETPAIGWAAGMERLINALKEKGIEIPKEKMTDIGLIQIGEKARKVALAIANELTEEGLRVTNILGKDSLKAQMRSANKLGAAICLILGQREVLDKSIIIKDMVSGFQETIRQDKLVEYLKKRLQKNK